MARPCGKSRSSSNMNATNSPRLCNIPSLYRTAWKPELLSNLDKRIRSSRFAYFRHTFSVPSVDASSISTSSKFENVCARIESSARRRRFGQDPSGRFLPEVDITTDTVGVFVMRIRVYPERDWGDQLNAAMSGS